MAETAAAQKRRAKSGRSPSFPGIPLRAAIERAGIIWERERRNPTPVRVVMKHWGYTNPSSGTASVAFAALKKFGLIEDEGSGLDRPARLTQLAFEILHNPDPKDAIRRAALTPPIHQEFWEEYGYGLPSDESLRYKLLSRGFTEAGARDFMREYRDTILFADLPVADEPSARDRSESLEMQPDSLPRAASASAPGSEERDRPLIERPVLGSQPQPVAGELSIPVPVVGGAAITISGRFPVKEAAWSQFLAVLAAMKPGLVECGDEVRESDF